jgi:hypothetical protein
MKKEEILSGLVKTNSSIIKNIMDDKECSYMEAVAIWIKINYNAINNYIIIHSD